MKGSKKITRRRHSAELKAQMLCEGAQPGASVARVALSHGINANIVHKWRRLAGATPLPVASFVPVALPAPACAAQRTAASTSCFYIADNQNSVGQTWI